MVTSELGAKPVPIGEPDGSTGAGCVGDSQGACINSTFLLVGLGEGGIG